MTGTTPHPPETTFWHPKGFTGLELERVTGTPEPLAPQLLGDYCLSLCLQGPATARYRNGLHALEDATFQSYGADEALAAAPPRGGRWSYQTLRISPELMRDLAKAAGRKLLPFALPVHSGAAGARLAGLFSAAFSSFTGDVPNTLGEAKLVAVTRALLAHQAAQPRPQMVTPRTARAVEVVRAHLQENVHAPTSLDGLAELAGVSKFHLNRTFKGAVGVTPAVFGMSLRVREAKARLRRGEPIAHVAVDLGFADQAHFSRTFKRYVGVTPGRYGASG